MRAEQRDIYGWTKRQYERRHRVAVEINRQDFSPDRGRHRHQSDAILRDAKSEVRYIGEVENHPARRGLIRASILADSSIGELKQQTRSRLILAVYTEYGIGPIRNFIERSTCLYQILY